MYDHGTALLDRPAIPALHTDDGGADSAQVSPVISAPEWFEQEPGAVVLRLEMPLSAGEMAAALFTDPNLGYADLATTNEVWGYVALAVASQGITAIRECAAGLESRAAVLHAHPEAAWLEFCHRRVAEAITARSSSRALVAGAAR